MNKTNEIYEKIYLKVFCIVIITAQIDISGFSGTNMLFGMNLLLFKIAIGIYLFGICIFELVLLNIEFINKQKYYYVFRLLELLTAVSLTVFFENKTWLLLAIILPVLYIALYRGRKYAVIISIYAFFYHLALLAFVENYFVNSVSFFVVPDIKKVTVYYLIIILICILSGTKKHDAIINNQNEMKDNIPAELTDKTLDEIQIETEEQRRDKASNEIQIEIIDKISNEVQDEATEENELDMETSYSKLVETNMRLEDFNTQLAESNAELFTVSHIVKKINSIISISELAACVNDIILGVMGATDVSLVFYDKEKDRLRLYATTVKDRTKQLNIADNVNCALLKDLLLKQDGFYDNFANPEIYPFIQEREVGSLMMLALARDSKKFGIVIIEHKINEYFTDEKLNFMEVVGQQILIAFEKAELYKKLHELATLDGLTGIYNRVYFQKRLSDEVTQAIKVGSELSLVIFDIDHFKKYNDTYGHIFGDKVLKHTVNVVKSSLRKADVIARFGGEEFVIILPTTHLNETRNKVEKIREKLENSIIIENGEEITVTASFGIASYLDVANTGDELIRAADSALYQAKNGGRNCVRVFSI